MTPKNGLKNTVQSNRFLIRLNKGDAAESKSPSMLWLLFTNLTLGAVLGEIGVIFILYLNKL